MTSPVTVSGWGSATQHNQLSIEVRDVFHGVPISRGSVEVRESGGGRPDRVTEHSLMPFVSGHIVRHDCDRTTGRYEVRVSAKGCLPWEEWGDLSVSDEPQHIFVALHAAD